MRRCLEKNLDYFERLTAEEQLDEIREFFYASRDNYDQKFIDTLELMLFKDTRSKLSLVNGVAHMNHVFWNETSKYVLNDQQKEELEQDGSTVVLVPRARDDVFTFWARSEGYGYRRVIEHTIVSAYEYKIWRLEDDN